MGLYSNKKNCLVLSLFTEMTSLKVHMRLKCHDKPHKCDICEKMFNNYSVMIVHKRIHFGERPYKCVDCGDRFNCVSSLKTHYKLHKQQNKTNFKWKGFVQTDSSMHRLKPNFKSLKGTKNYIKYSGLKKYLFEKANLLRHQCEFCNKTFQCELLKDFHQQLHHPLSDVKDDLIRTGNRFPCTSCDYIFADDETLQNHKKSKHNLPGKKKFDCIVCGYSTDRKCNFERHCNIHTEVKAIKCNTCGKCFTSKGSLNSHIKSVHNINSRYECDVCDKIFNKRCNLKQHVKAVHNKIKSFVCTECD